MRDHLPAEGIVAELSSETQRRILHDSGISRQTTTTWKASPNPDLITKTPAALNPATGNLFYRIHDRKRSRESSTRSRFGAAPGEKLYVARVALTVPVLAGAPRRPKRLST